MKPLSAFLVLLIGVGACARSNSAHEAAGAASLRAPAMAPPVRPRTGASTPSATERTETFQLGGWSLRLFEQSGGCFIFIVQEGHERAARKLTLLPPCRLHRTVAGAVRVESPHGAPTALIESSRPHPQLAQDCDTRLQGVRMVNGTLNLSTQTSRVASCPPFQWDLKLFSGLFELQ